MSKKEIVIEIVGAAALAFMCYIMTVLVFCL